MLVQSAGVDFHAKAKGQGRGPAGGQQPTWAHRPLGVLRPPPLAVYEAGAPTSFSSALIVECVSHTDLEVL